MNLNVNGTMYVLKHAAREMVRGGGGSFIGISSIAASNTHRWFGAYGVSKSAVDHMMQLAADELGPSWVRVNCLRPGLIRTELVEAVFQSPDVRPFGEISPWFDSTIFNSVEEDLATLKAQTHRRYIKSHLPFDALPVWDTVKYIHVGRDGRDLLLANLLLQSRGLATSARAEAPCFLSMPA